MSPAGGSSLTRPELAKVPATITGVFWAAKLCSTALGEATSDWLVHDLGADLAVIGGAIFFAVALWLQLRLSRYLPWVYWLAVTMVAVFGTMVADVVHVGLGIPYLVSTTAFALVLAAVFGTWWRVEGTLSIHSITTPRRELFYWAAVIATFALGTAAGALVAGTSSMGYLAAAGILGAIILIPALGYRLGLMGPVLAFWFAYVFTRPVGASIADWLVKPPEVSGLGLAPGPVVAVMLLALFACVLVQQLRWHRAGE